MGVKPVPLILLRSLEKKLPPIKPVRFFLEDWFGYHAYTGSVKMLSQNGSKGEHFATITIFDYPSSTTKEIITFQCNLADFRNRDSWLKDSHFLLETNDLITVVCDKHNKPKCFYHHQSGHAGNYGYVHLPKLFKQIRSMEDFKYNFAMTFKLFFVELIVNIISVGIFDIDIMQSYNSMFSINLKGSSEYTQIVFVCVVFLLMIFCSFWMIFVYLACNYLIGVFYLYLIDWVAVNCKVQRK